ncbi:hypothetical protein NH340_JMT08270 [Sarcoptes scabiei]|nr:hypothetical protein NH340_JMT08270 [Sarcoptes scabiei]
MFRAIQNFNLFFSSLFDSIRFCLLSKFFFFYPLFRQFCSVHFDASDEIRFTNQILELKKNLLRRLSIFGARKAKMKHEHTEQNLKIWKYFMNEILSDIDDADP